MLNAFLDPKTILCDLNIKVNRIPDITKCPSCESPEFHVGQDPNGGGWYTCHHCRWSGDSLELMARVKQQPIKEVLLDVKRRGAADLFTDERINEYMRYLIRKQGAQDFWNAATDRDYLMNLESQAARELMFIYKLPDLLERSTWKVGMGQFAGMASNNMYNQYLAPVGNGMAGGNRHFIVSPMFDVPGRMSSIALFDCGDGQKRYRSTALPFGTEDALLFLNSVYLHDDVIYATPDLSFALCLQIWSHQGLSGQLPLLGYTSETEKAWTNVRPQRVVFWDRQITDEIFMAARHISDRAYIATKPRFEDFKDPYWHLKTYTAQSFLACMRESSMPWLQALKEYLLAVEFGHASALIARLDLSPAQRQEMLKFCQNDAERKRIAGLIDIGVIEMRIPTMTRNKYLIQRADGWYMQSTTGPTPTLVSAAVPVIESFTNFKTRTLLSGHIRASGKTIPFEVDKEEFSASWLNDYCFRHGEPVRVHSAIERNLLYYALQFNKPLELDGLDSIGWDGTGFLFPQFTITLDGRILEKRRPLASEHPMQRLHYANTLTVANARSWLRDTPGYALYWAIMLSALTNMIAPAEGVATRGVGLVTRFSDDQTEILQGVIDDAALNTYKLRLGREREVLMSLLSAEHEHNVPLHVDFYGSPMLMRWMQTPENRNAITTITPGLSIPALLRGGWTIIDSKEPIHETISVAHGHAILPIILLEYVKGGCKLPRAPGHIISGVTELVRLVMHRKYGVEYAPVLNKALELVNVGTEDGSAGLSHRFIGMVSYLLNSGKLTMLETQDITLQPQERIGVQYGAGFVYLNLEVIQKAFIKAGLLFPDLSDLSQSFFEAKLLQDERYSLNALEGWVLHRDQWLAELKRWSDI